MILRRLTIALTMLTILALVPESAISASVRKPIKFYCNLIKKSRFLFWNYETTHSVMIVIYDSDNKFDYDSYKWIEGGIIKHSGEFYYEYEDIPCEEILGNRAQKTFTTEISDNDDEYFFKVRSKKDNSYIGCFVIDSGFQKSFDFELYKTSRIKGRMVYYDPPKVASRDIIYWDFRIERKKSDHKNFKLYTWYNPRFIVIRDKDYEEHRILIHDFDSDGEFEEYSYYIDRCRVAGTKFIPKFTSWKLWTKFYTDIVNNSIGYIELFDGKYRIPVYSKEDQKNVGFLEIDTVEWFYMSYCDVASFSNPFISTAAKFGLCHPSTAYVDYVNFVCQEPGFLDPKLQPFRKNLFVNEYLNGQTSAKQSSNPPIVFSLVANDN